MGRYAFFNTGLEYKFVFATQDSEDILQFGGWFRLAVPPPGVDVQYQPDTGRFNNSWTENPIVKWSAAENGPQILEKLRQIEHTLGYPECDFNAVSADLDGTHELKDTLYGKKPHNITAHFRYILGCLIYHQLLYTPVLQVHFEF